jgi:hypothetical protein
MDNNIVKGMRGYLFFLAAFGFLYIYTCSPGAQWQDSGMFQYRIWHNDIRGGLGLALAHPLYHLIGIAFKHISIGEFGFRVNLISALCGAITVANIYLFIYVFLDNKKAAAIGALSLGLSWTFWQHCTIAEVYTLYTALLSLELLFLVLYFRTAKPLYLLLMMFANGVSIANHMFGIIPCSCYVLLALYLLYNKQISLKHIVFGFCCWMIGALPYTWLIFDYYLVSNNFIQTIRSALFGEMYSEDVLSAKMTMTIVKENLIFICYNFASPSIIFIGLGFVYLRRQVKQYWQYLILLAIILLFFLFAFRYTVPDRYAFFIPFYLCCALLVGVGAKHILDRFNTNLVFVFMVIFTFSPVVIYAVVPKIAQQKSISMGTNREIPYRNEYQYFLTPWQGANTAPTLFAKEALEAVSDDGVIFADGTTLYALWYMQTVFGMKPDVQVVSDHGDYDSPFPVPDKKQFKAMIKTRAIYVVSPVSGYCPNYLLDKYTFTKTGSIFKISIKKDTRKK